MLKKRILILFAILIASIQFDVFSSNETNSVPSDTNSISLINLEEARTTINLLRLKIKNIIESIDTVISETKELHKDIIDNDPDVLLAERKVELARKVVPLIRSKYLVSYEEYNMEVLCLRCDVNSIEKTLKVTKYENDGSSLTVTFRYPSSNLVEQATREVKNEKRKFKNSQSKELLELDAVRNSTGFLYQSLDKIRKMLDSNSVNFEQVKQEIDGLDKKITDADMAAQSELQRINEKYHGNVVTEGKSDKNNMADEDDIEEKMSTSSTKDGYRYERKRGNADNRRPQAESLKSPDPPDIKSPKQVSKMPSSQQEKSYKPVDAVKLLPAFKKELQGTNEVRVRNPNNFSVTAGIRSGEYGKNFVIPANGVQSVYVSDGTYNIYFVYSSKPDALFQGDSFTLLNHNGIEIQIVQVVNGNYNIRQVK